MWLITMLILAIFSTVIWYIWDESKAYRLDVLVLTAWGTTIMVFADHLASYITEGEFMEISADALLLGVVLATLAMLIWVAALLISDPKGKLKRAMAPRG